MSIIISGDSPNLTSANLTTPIVTTTMGVGGATPAASGSGITFPATQSASSDANTLDDYEEGTWTPTDASGAGLTFTVNAAKYIKIGQIVYLSAYFSYPSTANGSAAWVGGLPFTAANNGTYPQIFTRCIFGAFVSMQVFANTTQMAPNNSSNTQYNNSQMSSQPVLFAGVYQASA